MAEFLQHTLNGLALGSIYGLIALGYTMVYGVLQLINFAHGDIFMVGAFAGLMFLKMIGVDLHPSYLLTIVTILFAMLVTSIFGVTIERLAYRPLRRAPRINILITAIGMSLFLEYTGQLIFTASPRVFPSIIPSIYFDLPFDLRLNSVQVSIFFISMFLTLILQYLVFKTQFGRAMRAISHNIDTASLIGINVNKVIMLTFVLGSGLAGAGGVLFGLAYPKIDPLLGLLPGLKAFVAAVLGGIGNIAGAVLGAVVLGMCETYVAGYLSSTYKDALAFLVLILVLTFKPNGLLGKKTIEKV